ncbi:phage tail protein I [Pseudomonas monteilii]|uniref:phage tail protein I n=1 Tax=Pseudomonas monteilii TaxID=76759 RepID=UPI001CBD592F|nr:phage tail protein I [Pseudomonas monteilii]MBZ3661982.1 phage tail protein I [Pseudomonas monteilii]MBZ3667308.1 phage tail protein I [Pseudomonas monteilii]
MSLLPHNATPLERALEAAGDLGLDPDIIRGVADSARCPPNFLPWLAWAWKVEGWEAAYTDDQRRELIREAIPVHKTKGTVGAIRRVLKAVRVNADYKEWREIPNAAPYTFQVTAWANENRPGEGSIISPQLEERLRALVDATKNERSHYTFRLGARFDDGLVAANASQLQQHTRRSAEAQPIPMPPSEQGLGLVNASRLQQVQRHAGDSQAVPMPLSEQALLAANATHIRCVSRWSSGLRSVPTHNETVLLTANAVSTRTIVRVTMEAVQ